MWCKRQGVTEVSMCFFDRLFFLSCIPSLSSEESPSVLSCLPACINTVTAEWIFAVYWKILLKSVEMSEIWLKSDKNIGRLSFKN